METHYVKRDRLPSDYITVLADDTGRVLWNRDMATVNGRLGTYYTMIHPAETRDEKVLNGLAPLHRTTVRDDIMAAATVIGFAHRSDISGNRETGFIVDVWQWVAPIESATAEKPIDAVIGSTTQCDGQVAVWVDGNRIKTTGIGGMICAEYRMNGTREAKPKVRDLTITL